MPLCAAKSCEKSVKFHLYCPKHRMRLKHHGNPIGGRAFNGQWKGVLCAIRDCTGNAVKKGYCNKHYLRLRVHGDPLYQIRAANGEGGIKDGYRTVTVNGKTVRAHRLIMENILGRPLTQYEIVHHKDGNKTNNDPSNLEILTRSVHTKLHAPEKPQYRPENTATHKYCPQCGTAKLRESAFYRSSRTPDGLTAYCIECTSTYNKRMHARRRLLAAS